MENKGKPKRILGIDYGTRRLGLALSDERKVIATPLETLQAEQKTEQTITKFLTFVSQLQQELNCEIEEIIIGLPLMMSGKTGLLADEVKHFVETFSRLTSLPIRTWDERLSTIQAERSLRETQFTRKKRSKLVDKVSAAIILQSYLDYRQVRQDSSSREE